MCIIQRHCEAEQSEAVAIRLLEPIATLPLGCVTLSVTALGVARNDVVFW